MNNLIKKREETILSEIIHEQEDTVAEPIIRDVTYKRILDDNENMSSPTKSIQDDESNESDFFSCIPYKRIYEDEKNTYPTHRTNYPTPETIYPTHETNYPAPQINYPTQQNNNPTPTSRKRLSHPTNFKSNNMIHKESKERKRIRIENLEEVLHPADIPATKTQMQSKRKKNKENSIQTR